MPRDCRRFFAILLSFYFFVACARAQSPQAVTTQILVDSLASAGGAVAPGWAGSIGNVNDAANIISLGAQGNYLGAFEYGVNSATVTAEGKLGGPVAAGLTQGALDFGDNVIAPQVASALVYYFPGVFIPAQTANLPSTNPFGTPPSRSSSQADNSPATDSSNPFGSTTVQSSARSSAIGLIPVNTAALQSNNFSTISGLQSPSNAWLVALMNNPNNDLGARKLAAIALGINPDIITSNPIATGLLKAVYGVPTQGAVTAAGVPNPGTKQTISSTPSAAPTSGSVTTIVPGHSDDHPKVTIINPQSSSSSSTVIQTIIPGREPTRNPTNGAAPSIALQTPSPPQAARSSPGGISLSKAAAERMPVDLSIDAAYFSNGRLVLSGQKSGEGIDAALFLTAMRAACEFEDPYFSLDPPNGAAWLSEGKNATENLWQHVQNKFKTQPSQRDLNTGNPILEFQTVSAHRDYPDIWKHFARLYPDLKSNLVFRPEWLRETRFGEIFYKADILLKELAFGVPLLEHESLRALSVEGYSSAGDRNSAEGLLNVLKSSPDPSSHDWEGVRLWFDLVPQALQGSPNNALQPVPLAPASQTPNQPTAGLSQLLADRGLAERTYPSAKINALHLDKGVLDLSEVFPKMYVRRHDTVTGQDVPGQDPALDALARDVNGRIEAYLKAYREISDLTNLFRAYIAAVHIAHSNVELCSRIHAVPLLNTEKVQVQLPATHPTEIFVTFASYEFTEGRSRRLAYTRGYAASGGVTVAARTLFETAPLAGTTALTGAVALGVMVGHDQDRWNIDGRQFVAFDVEKDLPASMWPAPAWPAPSIISPISESVAPPVKLASRNGTVQSPAALRRQENPRQENPLTAMLFLVFGLMIFLTLFGTVRRRQIFAHTGSENTNGASWRGHAKQEKPGAQSRGEVERLFNEAFAANDKSERERIISAYQKEHGGSRTENMLRAMDDLEKYHRTRH